MNESNSLKISIIVPVYNVQEYLEECINSLLGQTLKEIEIILVDDGSTDNSGKICDEYASKNKKVKVFHQKNGGQSRARNEGIKYAQGEYIMFVDSDDYIVSNACEVLYTYALKNNVDIVWGDVVNDFDPKEHNRAKRFPSYLNVSTCRELLIEAMDVYAYDIVPWLKIVRKNIFDLYDLRFMDGCYYEDQEYTLRMHLLENVTMMRVDFPFYYYRSNRADSTTNIHNLKKGTDFIKVIHEMIKCIEKENLDSKIKDYAENVVAMAIYHLSSIFILMKKEDRKIILSLIDSKIISYSKKNKHLTKRMKIQNFLFIKCPWLLNIIFKVKRNVHHEV